MNNSSDTQHISPVHLPSSTYLAPAPMEATVEVAVPPSADSGALRLPGGRTITPASEQPPQHTTTSVPPEYEPEPYSTTRLPLSYPLLWEAHQGDCSVMRGMFLGIFTVFILILSAAVSMTIFVASGMLLSALFVVMLIFKGN